MRNLFHSVVTGLIVGTLVTAPLAAAPAAPVASPIGVILQADKAQVGGGETANGASIFDGDRVSTSASGLLRVSMGASQALLPENSSADFHQSGRGVNADLNGGTIVLSTTPGETFLLHANGASIRPATAQMTIAQVTKVSANELLLTSRKGVLEVSAEDEVKSIPEGSSYRMIIQPADPASPQVAKAGRNKVIWILIIAAGVGAGIGIWRAVISPDKP